MKHCRALKIRGQRWRIIYGRPPVNKCSAYCDYASRTIWIRKGEDPIACIIHEVLHACFCDLNEDAVIEAEEALVKALELVPAL